MSTTRRRFLQTTAALAGLGDLSFLGRLGPVSAAEAELDPKLVRLQSDIEPLVRLLEETPRPQLLEEVAARIRRGLSYREVLTALLLAGVRNVQPRPHVGFKFHAVLVVNSAHLASLASPDSDRWLPLFWALDYFKTSQAETAKESSWRMGPVEETKVPPARKARQAFIDAMDGWDEAAADVAVVGLARSAGAAEVFELFARYGARDFRDIGHKAIYVANAFRTLRCIGWQYAEPVLRSLAYALQMRDGQPPSAKDLPVELPGVRNAELARKVPDAWLEGKPDPAATLDLLATLRDGSADAASDKVVELLGRGVAPQSLWDAILAGSGELLMRQPGIVGLHTITTSNALRYAFETSGDDAARRWLLLQNAAFLPLFREVMRLRGPKMGAPRVDQLEAAAEVKPVAEIFAAVGKDRAMGAELTLAYLKDGRTPEELIAAARRLVFLKGTDSHDYKFSSALLEDYYHVSPAWRDRYLAAGTYWLRGSTAPDNKLVERSRAALAG